MTTKKRDFFLMTQLFFIFFKEYIRIESKILFIIFEGNLE